ncbi:MAG: VWA domain-containing protein, partial [Eubacteriales bacterium]
TPADITTAPETVVTTPADVTTAPVTEVTIPADVKPMPDTDGLIPEKIRLLMLETLFSGDQLYRAIYQSGLTNDEIAAALTLLSPSQTAELNRFENDQLKKNLVAAMSAEQLYTYIMSLEAAEQLYLRTYILTAEQSAAIDAYGAALDEQRRQDELRASLAAMDDETLDAYLMSLDQLTRDLYENTCLSADRLASLIAYRADIAYRAEVSAMTVNELYDAKAALGDDAEAVAYLLGCAGAELRASLSQLEAFIQITRMTELSNDEELSNYIENSASDVKNVYYGVLSGTLLSAEIEQWLCDIGVTAQLEALSASSAPLHKWVSSLTPGMRALVISRLSDVQRSLYESWDPLSEYPPAEEFTNPAPIIEAADSARALLSALDRPILSSLYIPALLALAPPVSYGGAVGQTDKYYNGAGDEVGENSADVVLKKGVRGYNEETGEGTITLEAYVTGSTTTTTTEKPTDIVLVLDVSGSMKYDMSANTGSSNERLNALKTAVNGFLDNIAEKNALITDAAKQHRVSIVTFSGGAQYVFGGSEYSYIDSGIKKNKNAYDSNEQLYVMDTDNKYYPVTIVRTGSSGNRVYTYTYNGKTVTSDGSSTPPPVTLYKFVNNISGALEAIVSDGTSSDSLTTAKNAVDALTASGSTRTDYGMQYAYASLTNAVSTGYDRNKVVILFTDGVPTENSSFNKTVANSAVSYANDMKNYGAGVYSISIANGSGSSIEYSDELTFDENNNLNSGNENVAMNRFMQYVSSNYAKRTAALGVETYTARSAASGDKTDLTKDSYYLTTSTSDGLLNIFQQISSSINTSNVALSSATALSDSVSDYFTFADGIAEGVTVSKVPKTADGWGTPVIIYQNGSAVANSGISVAISGKTISVQGFDYAANYVSQTLKNSGDYGYKLVVAFGIAADNNYTGLYTDNGIVPTNKPDAEAPALSDGGLVKPNGSKPTWEFGLPTVNLAASGTITVTKTADDAGAQREFIFTIKNSDGDTVARLTLNAGETKIVKGLKPGIYTVTEDGEWSWRFEQESFGAVYSDGGSAAADISVQKVNVKRSKKITTDVTITNSLKTDKWLDYETGWQNRFDGTNTVPAQIPQTQSYTGKENDGEI